MRPGDFLGLVVEAFKSALYSEQQHGSEPIPHKMTCPLANYRLFSCQSPFCQAEFLRFGTRLFDYEWRSHANHVHGQELSILKHLTEDLLQVGARGGCLWCVGGGRGGQIGRAHV